MKTRFNSFGKCGLSIILAVMMLVSTTIIGSGNASVAATAEPAAQTTEAASDIAAPEQTEEAEQAAAPAATPQPSEKKLPEKSGATGTRDVTVYLNNTWLWSDIKIYSWYSNNGPVELTGNWDNRQSMDDYSGSIKYKTISNVPNSVTSINCIITFYDTNNGNCQTVELTVQEGQMWAPSGWNNENPAKATGGWSNLPAENGKWYIVGKFGDLTKEQTTWDTECTKFPMTYDSTDNVYKYNTNLNMSELSGKSSILWFGFRQYDNSAWGTHYNTALSNGGNYNLSLDNVGKASEIAIYGKTDSNFHIQAQSNTTGNVTICLDTAYNPPKMYLEIDNYTPPAKTEYNIYLDTYNWSSNTTPYAHIYGTDFDDGWPGTQMTLYAEPSKDGVTHKIYKATINTSLNISDFKVIFNKSGSDQKPSSDYYNFVNNHVYTMSGDSDKTISSYLSEFTAYNVNKATGKESYITLSSATAYEGSPVNVTIGNIDSGKTVSSVTVTDATGANVAVTGSGTAYSFTMPGSAVTVDVTFRLLYTYSITVNSNNTELGTVATSAATVTEGGNVTLTASPKSTNAFTGWTLSSGEGVFANASATSTTFTPSGTTTDITILGSFDEGTIENVSGKYVVYGTGGKNHPGSFDNCTQVKKITYGDNSVKYFVDFANSTFNGGSIYFAVSTSSTPNYFWGTNYSGKKTIEYVSPSADYVNANGSKDYNEEYYEGTQKNSQQVKFAEISLKDYDAVEKVRVYFSSNNTPTADNPTTYTIDATIDATAATYSQVYAKDGTIRDSYEKYSQLADTVMTLANGTALDHNDAASVAKSYNTNGLREYAKVAAGTNLKITTTIQAAYANTYYVKGFCVNGVTYGAIDEPAVGDARREKTGTGESGKYSFIYTVPDNTNYVEITPIYFYFENGGDQSSLGFITFHVEKYTGSIQAQWGNTISCQTWYTSGNETSGAGDTNKNALGGFPGQPLVYVDGDYFMQVPKRLPVNESGTVTVQGMTLSNYYWDSIHQYIAGKDASFKGTKNDRTDRYINSQTYDYNDFAALAKMGADDIIFTFKYRSARANKDNTTAAADLNNSMVNGNISVAFQSGTWNGWDAFVDYYDRAVDLAGNFVNNPTTKAPYTEEDLVGANGNKTYTTSEAAGMIWVVSRGYQAIKNNNSGYYGNYATIWDVYKYENGFQLIGSLPGSSFIPASLNEEANYQLVNGKLPTKDDTANAAIYNANKAKYLDFANSEDTYRDRTFDTFVTIYNATLGMPTMIAFEKAIAEAGVQNDPALRCDGRWYYSIEKSGSVNANLKIEYKPLNGSAFISDTNYNNGTGSTTNATVRFTNPDNEDKTKVWKDTTGVHATESYSTTEYFGFNADSYSTNTVDGQTHVYKFVGWYVLIGSNYTAINPTDLANVDGRYQRRVENDYVARYEEIDASKVAIIDHEVLSNATYNGGGKTYTTIQVYNNGTLVKTYPKSQGPVQITADVFENSSYTYKVTLTAEPDDYSRYDGTFTTNVATPPSVSTAGYANPNGGPTTIWERDFTKDQLSAVIDNTTRTVIYYSGFNLRTFAVTYKYYDRNTDPNSYIDVNDDATKSVLVNVPYRTDQTISDIIISGLNQNVESGGSMSKLSNILDKYYLWSTQAAATNAETGFPNLPDYTTALNGSKTYNDGNYTVANHCDHLGRPVASEGDFNWVNYYSDSTKVATPANESTLKPGDSSINSVTVWAFNTPKTYTAKFVYPKYVEGSTYSADISKFTQLGDNSGIRVISEDQAGDGDEHLFIETTFYGQRLGLQSQDAELNYPGTHLKNYSHAEGDNLVGYTNHDVRAVTEFTVDNVTYTFDGWYEKSTGAKVGSDFDYGYRVTNSATFFAGYKTTAVDTNIGVSLSENEPDYYFETPQDGANEITQKLRFNTELNVYNSEDRNSNIKKTAAIYVRMRVQGAGTGYTTEDAEKIVNDPAFITAVRTEIQANLNQGLSSGTIVVAPNSTSTYKNGSSYTSTKENGSVKVAVEYTYVYDNNNGTAGSSLQLNVKNRAIYTTVFNVDDVIKNAPYSAVLVFGAINVDDGTNSASWILSDNHIDYIDVTNN